MVGDKIPRFILWYYCGHDLLSFIGKDWDTSVIFGILGDMNSWNGRFPELNSPLLRFTMTFGLSCWTITYPSVIGCLAYKVLNLFHKNGLAYIETQWTHCLNGWLVLVISRNSTLVLCILVRNLWALPLSLLLACNTWFLHRWNQILRMWHHQRLS